MRRLALADAALVVALCLTVDVANPLMPGALGLGLENSIDSRQADRPRADDVTEPPGPTPTRERVELLDRAIASRPAVPDAPRARAPRAPRRTPPAPSARAVPDPGDDH
jgi:hypothetical protein